MSTDDSTAPDYTAIIEWLESPIGDAWSLAFHGKIDAQSGRYVKDTENSNDQRWFVAWASLEPPEPNHADDAPCFCNEYRWSRYNPKAETYAYHGLNVKIEEDEYVASLSSPA